MELETRCSLIQPRACPEASKWSITKAPMLSSSAFRIRKYKIGAGDDLSLNSARGGVSHGYDAGSWWSPEGDGGRCRNGGRNRRADARDPRLRGYRTR